MSVDLDIYVMTEHRDFSTVENFIRTFADRDESEDRLDEELMMIPLNHHATVEQQDTWEWEPALTLTHVINRGLDYPRRAFAVYLKPKDETISRAILAFTTDNQLVIGLSIDDTGAHPENQQYARKLLKMLAEQYEATLGLIMVEQPPPLSERAFRQREGTPLTVHFWQRQLLKH